MECVFVSKGKRDQREQERVQEMREKEIPDMFLRLYRHPEPKNSNH